MLIDIPGTATGSEVAPISVLKALIIKSRKNHQSTRTIACTTVVPTGVLKAVILRPRGRIKLILFFSIVGP
jgi:alcohol dehydrogenase class IV